ncbi:type 1 glutamine amidotransferase [Paracoccus suum]|uniref:Type 1 glutamine amidotransferase n=1 Tax=Paracoccus suum TaxID=2259340 RepID=A0A344PG83_9RHOB|nr:type 1 glutamine amidotransferase [Paracoccus suum]AXC48388.1 type 1 glutamine amidotransferase [Paracoccus suum]
MRIGILKAGQSPDMTRAEFGDYDNMFEVMLAGRGFTFDSYHVEAMEFPASVHAAEAWLITGSRHGVYEDHAFIPPLEDFIRRAYEAAVPMVGICFGHQIIAHALGGKVEKFAGGWAVGAQDYQFEGQPVTLNAWHQDQVTTRPPGAEIAASNAFCENAALVYGDRAFTVQAHPEFGEGFIEALMTHRAPGVVPEPLLDTARDRLGPAKDQALIADRIEAFLRQPRTALGNKATEHATRGAA